MNSVVSSDRISSGGSTSTDGDPEISVGCRPKHVAIIADGNRRWAKRRGLTSGEGTAAGGRKVQAAIEWCEDLGIPVVTVFLMSERNLDRCDDDLLPLLEAIERLATSLAATQRWRIRPIGQLERLPSQTLEALERAAEQTRDVGGVVVNLAVAYDGRKEITGALRRVLAAGTTAGLNAQALDEDQINHYLHTSGQPDPDLIIRTAGEQRLSGFMLWQSFDAQLHFCDVLWPDFEKEHLLQAVHEFATQRRTFGQ